MECYKKILLVTYLIILWGFQVIGSDYVIRVPLIKGDATSEIRKAFEEAQLKNHEKVIIEFENGDYNISRDNALPVLYHMSNTASEKENPDPTKHIGIFMKNLNDIIIKGNGAKIITHGEMTPFVVDSCVRIEISDLTLTAADPTVTEIIVKEVGEGWMTFEVLPMTEFSIDNGVFSFIGEGWSFGDPASGRYAIAQVYHPDTNTTKRCGRSPLRGYVSVEQLGPRMVRMKYEQMPEVSPGEIYQFRHWIRNEVGWFVNHSKDISFKDITINYMGNFGFLSQFSENITMEKVACCPDEGSGRTNACFADFFHFSGCKGLIKIKDCTFIGAQDDGINIHGTHLKVVDRISSDKLHVRFMHPQTFGFQPFSPDDEIEVVNAATLNAEVSAKVKSVEKIDDYNFIIELDKELPEFPGVMADLVVENVTWTPEVEITGNYFARIPTRGILLTTRRKSLIENNTFYRLPMAAILVADDASSWYESGPVRDLTIRGNKFIECSIPNILIEPEIREQGQPVHSNIIIEHNEFFNDSEDVIRISGSENVTIRDNEIIPL